MNDRAEFVLSALVECGAASREGVARARAYASEHGMQVLEALAVQGVVTRKQIAVAHAEISECNYVDLGAFDVAISNARLLPRATAQRLRAFPLFHIDESVTVAMADPLDLSAVDQLRLAFRAEVEPVLCELGALDELIARAYALSASVGEGEPGAGQGESLVTGEEPIVAAVNQILAQGAQDGASDIHINPGEQELLLRYRIDGRLQKRQGPAKSAHAGIVQRLKVMASLDLTQTRRPQDGKFRFVHSGRAVDVRLSVIPTIYGENIVMRLLASGTAIRDFSELGVAPDTIAQIEAILDHPHGMMLVTGPTGSGKTTTLYTALKRLNTPDRNVMTIEDPVEIRLPRVQQVQVHAEIGMTFAGALRSILRQDPDVILLGEIRDDETARIAVQAALTGHMVLSTLHTNDAPGAVPRLRDLGVPGFAINAALLGILSQRLVRRVCDACARPSRPDELLLRRFGLGADESGFMQGGGCAKCMSSGHRGRLTITELFAMNPALQRVIDGNPSGAALREAAVAQGMRPMWRDGLDKARLGLTSLEEVARAVAVNLEERAPGAPAIGARAA